MSAARPLRLEDQLCFAVYSAAHAFGRFYRPMLAELGLTYPQYLVLLVLWEGRELSVSALGDRLLLDSGTLTPLLKRMEAMGLVTRRRSETDERQVLVGLTGKAADMKAVAETFPHRILSASDCSADEVESLRTMLNGLRLALDAAA